jgi:hypothetical protein
MITRWIGTDLDQKFDVSTLESGQYVLKIIKANEIAAKKMIIRK